MLKKSSKFLVTSQYQKIELEFNNKFEVNEFNIKWSRQFRSTDSMKFDGSTVWNIISMDEKDACTGGAIFRYSCKPWLKVTLHRNKKGGFEKKLYRYAVESIGYDEKVKTLASAELDLSEYADVSGSEQNIAIMLEPKKKYVLKAVLHFTLSFEFIRSGSSKDDDMISTWSRESLDLDAFTPDDQDESQGDDMVNLSVSSFVHTIRKHRTEVVLAVETQDFFESLSNCQLIVIVCNAEFTQISPELVATTNNFYAKAKARFGDSVELFYLSFDKNEDTFLASLQTHKLRCPAIKPFSKLHDTISQNYDITKVPYLIVLSEGKLVGCASNFASISAHLNAKSAEKRVEKWLGRKNILRGASGLSNSPSFDKEETGAEQKTESLPSQELETKILRLRERSLRRKSKMSVYVEKESNISQRLAILQAESNVKSMMLKRGQGFKGRIWRMRQFQYDDGKIVYIDTKKNEIKGQIDLTEVVSFDLVAKDEQDKNEASFNIVTYERVYQIQARDYEHMTTWINAAAILQNTLSQLKVQ